MARMFPPEAMVSVVQLISPEVASVEGSSRAYEGGGENEGRWEMAKRRLEQCMVRRPSGFVVAALAVILTEVVGFVDCISNDLQVCIIGSCVAGRPAAERVAVVNWYAGNDFNWPIRAVALSLLYVHHVH